VRKRKKRWSINIISQGSIGLKTTVTTLNQFWCPAHNYKGPVCFKWTILIYFCMYNMTCIIVLELMCQLAISKWKRVKTWITLSILIFLRFFDMAFQYRKNRVLGFWKRRKRILELRWQWSLKYTSELCSPDAGGITQIAICEFKRRKTVIPLSRVATQRILNGVSFDFIDFRIRLRWPTVRDLPRVEWWTDWPPWCPR